jgi:hypothetical protein
VGGFISIVEKSPRRESSMTRFVSPDLATTDGSEVELQWLTSTGEGHESVKDGNTGVDLGLNASGPILTTNLPRRSPYVLGMKRAWKTTFASRETSSVDDE